MHAAAFENDTEMLEFLFSVGAKLDSEMNDGSTPFHDACEGSAKDSIQWLLKHGIDPTIQKTLAMETPLFMGVGESSILELLLKDKRILAQIQTPNRFGNTPLHQTISNAASTQILLAFGANPNAQNIHGETPLHLAVKCQSRTVLEYLIQAGGQLSLKTKKNQSVISLAYPEVKKYLIPMSKRLKYLKIAFRICRIFMSSSKAFNSPYFIQIVMGVVRVSV